MKTTILRKKKNYIGSLILMLFSVLILMILFDFMRHPSDYTYFLIPTRNSVVIFSIVGILPFLLFLYILLKNILRKDPYLEINKLGILNDFFLHEKKLIRWEDISKIETIRYSNNKYIGIFLHENQNNEKGISWLFFKIYKISLGTPFIINPVEFDYNFNDLMKLILENYEESKEMLSC